MLKPGTAAILNPRLLAALAGAGHGDLIVIADSGLPMPREPEVLDLSFTPGVPSFLQVLDGVRDLLAIESVLLAHETRTAAIHPALEPRLDGMFVEEVSHEEFKRRSRLARTVIRTGECTPYANIGLVAGVSF